MAGENRPELGLFGRIKKRGEEKSRLAAAFAEGNQEEVKLICESADPASLIYAIDEAARKKWWQIVDHAVENYVEWIAKHAVDAEAGGKRWHTLLALSEKRLLIKAPQVQPYILKKFELAGEEDVAEAIISSDWVLVKAFAEHAKGDAAALAKDAYARNMSSVISNLTEKACADLAEKIKKMGKEPVTQAKHEYRPRSQYRI